MAEIGYTAALYRKRLGGLAGSKREATTGNGATDVSSYTDKTPGWECTNDKKNDWRVIYEYYFKPRGCKCNTTYFVVKTDYRTLPCGGLVK